MLNWRGGAVALVLAAGLAGCSQPDTSVQGPSLDTRPADAARAVADAPAEFAFLRYQIDVTGDAPRLCLGFTQPLDPQADYEPYVALEPERPVAMAVSGESLCLGGLAFGEGQSVTLRSGFPAADGRALRADEEIEIDFGDRPAYVGIAGSGVILPRLEADGLAIETVNVDTVEVTLWRVTDRALAFRSITSGFTAGFDEYDWQDQDESPFPVAERLWRGEMDTRGTANAPVTTVFPLAETIGQLRPGAYYVQVVDAAESEDDFHVPARSSRWLVITDLALTAYRGRDGIDYVVRSLQTAQPVPGVRVELVARSNEILGTATTDANGRARFAGPLMRGEEGNTPRLLTAYGPDNDFAVLDLQRNPVDLSGQDIAGRDRSEGADGFVYLDRGIYRPGEEVHIAAMMRDGQAVSISNRSGDLVLYGPNGIEAARERFEGAPIGGTVFWDYDLARESARGEWRVDAMLDGYGLIAQSRFSVEDFVPQRIALDLTADTETPMRAGEARDVEADVRFLYGAPGAGLPVEGTIRIETDPNPFPDHARFAFGRHDESFRETGRDLRDAIADGAGHAVLRVDPEGEGEGTSAPLRIRTVISAIEPGGRPVADDVRIPYRPRDLYLGIDPQFEGRLGNDSAASFDVVGLTPLGELRTARLDWQVIRVDWNYDWYRTEGGAWRWRRTQNSVVVEDGVTVLSDDAVSQIDIAQLSWGDYQLVVTDSETGVSASTRFWVGWGRSSTTGDDAPDRVRLAGPDQPVATGEVATISILPPYAGEAEIVIASDHVLATQSVFVPESGAEVSFPVTAEWGAGAYAMVSVFTPRDPVAQPRPRRAVGVTYLPVDTGDRLLTLSLDAPELARPRQPLEIAITATGPVRSGAWVTVAAVDEGILALTRFQSPDPVGWYFGRSSLAVELLDDYGRLLDPNQGAAAPVRSGGDQIGGAGLTVVPTRTVALFSGPVAFDRAGNATVTLDIPDFNGELRLMAVAWSGSGLGQAAQPLTVRDQVPAELILPRFLAPGDASMTTLTIDNVEGAAGVYAAAITASGAVNADSEDSLELASGDRIDRRYPVSGADAGIGEVGLTVDGPAGFAVSRSYPIEVRSAWLPSSQVVRGRVEPGENWSLDSATLAAFLPGSSEVSVSFSATPLDENALLRSLSRYPYGCTEQITSRALPLLYAGDLAALSGADGFDDARIQIQDAIATLLSREATDGAIGLWRVGDRGATPWLGAYAVDFLARAKTAGYTVPDAAMERAYAALEHVAAQELWRASGYESTVYRWVGQTDTAQRLSDRSAAYALYVLARAGRADRSRLRYMHDERLEAIASPLARAQIGAALYLIGDRARAHNAFMQAEAALGYSNRGDWYQTPRRDLAGVLALAAEAGESDLVGRLAERVAHELPEPGRLTTQEKAFLLLAAQALSAGTEALEIESTDDTATPGQRDFTLTPGELVEARSFANRGANPVWVTQIAHGETLEAPQAVAEQVTVAKHVRAMDGTTVDLTKLVQGDRLIIGIEISPSEQRTIPAILVDLLPAGLEIEAIVRPEEAGPNGVYTWLGEINDPRIAEARDDRFVAAIDLRSGRPAHLAYIVRAVTPGDYTMPGVVVEDMYRPDVFARSETGQVTIRPRD
ncbi:alpha-2-macroglobulin family protein [Maricaulis sp.]|uniref:alpha-2-macroglobulin family protein n=1 Tax=Maricaulis sp. TaxID=1486257 RepID=UPI003A9169EC